MGEHHEYSDTNDILYVVHHHKRNHLSPMDHNLYSGPGFGVPHTKKMVSNPRETFNLIFYSFLGLFKIVFLFFNLVPYVALLIVR